MKTIQIDPDDVAALANRIAERLALEGHLKRRQPYYRHEATVEYIADEIRLHIIDKGQACER